jgi:hypothetical protein
MTIFSFKNLKKVRLTNSVDVVRKPVHAERRGYDEQDLKDDNHF